MTGHTARIIRRIAAARMPFILVGLIIAASIANDGKFANIDNLVNVMRQVSFEATIAFGMTLIIITGGIDLSVGSLIALTGVAAAIVMRETGDWPIALVLVLGLGGGLAAGGAVGAINGVVVARFAVPPFIVTLAAMLMARGGAFILCDGQPVYELPEQLRFFGRGFVAEPLVGRVLPVTVLVMLSAYGMLAFTLARTVFGRQVLAVGSNEDAARLAGIPVRRTKFMVYLITGLLCGLVGFLFDAKLMAGDPTVGQMWELNVIAAVVVGGTSLFGGRGSMTGTLVGALIIGVLNNSLNLLRVEHFWQLVVLGGVILGAALIDSLLRRLEGHGT
jgi:ribose transport system permease protein